MTDPIFEIARHLPCRVIMNEQGPYLERYLLATKLVHKGAVFCSDCEGIRDEDCLGRAIECPKCRGSRTTGNGTCGVCQSFIYLHHFLASDATTELHDHPWVARVTILEGSYVEHKAIDNDVSSPWSTLRQKGDTFDLKSTTKHRVELLPSTVCVCGHDRDSHKANTSQCRACPEVYTTIDAEYARCERACTEFRPAGVIPAWSLCEVGPRLKSWGFTDIATGRYTPWREALKARGLL